MEAKVEAAAAAITAVVVRVREAVAKGEVVAAQAVEATVVVATEMAEGVTEEAARAKVVVARGMAAMATEEAVMALAEAKKVVAAWAVMWEAAATVAAATAGRAGTHDQPTCGISWLARHWPPTTWSRSGVCCMC
jgi:hypothetical protein